MIESYKELMVKRNNEFYLDSMDYQVLTMLYKPFVGPRCIDFYLSLYQLSYKDNPIKKSLLYIKDIISDNSLTDSDIDIYIEHLSKLKLLKQEKDLIELFPCYSVKDFFNSKFISYLKGITAKCHFLYLQDRFYPECTNVDIAKDISLANLSKEIEYKKRKNDRIPFDFESFISNVQIANIDSLKKDKDFFVSLSFVYDLSLESMISILYEAENDGEYEKDSIIKIAHSKFLKNLEKRERANNKISSDERYIDHFKETPPEVVLNMGAQYVSLADKKTIERLRSEKHIKDELISILIIYSLVTNDRKMHPYVFYEKVVNDWHEKNITSAEDAYFYINQLYNKQDKKTRKEKITQSSESWFDDYWNKIKEEKEKNDRC